MNIYHERYIDGQSQRALTMLNGNNIVGYITLRTPADDSSEQRLGFVIVDDSKRGQGFGKTLVSMAVKYAFETLGATKVSLGVFENNPAARRCYERLGLTATGKYEVYHLMGEDWNFHEMEISREKWTEGEQR